MNDNTDLILTPDSRAVAMREVSNMFGAMRTLYDGLKDGAAVDRAHATTVLKVSEHYLADLGKALGVQTDSARDREQRSADLRAANQRVHTLEAQLGNAQGPDVTQAALNQLVAQLNGWWSLEGTGLVSDVAFSEHCCTVTFSCSLFGTFRLIDSETPVSDKEQMAIWYQGLRERGFVLTQEDSRDVSIVDCDASRKVFMDLFKLRLPSATVWQITNVRKHKSNEFVMRSIEVHIHRIADIITLPVPPKNES